jgi:hypothetical protein
MKWQLFSISVSSNISVIIISSIEKHQHWLAAGENIEMAYYFNESGVMA